MKRMKRLRSVLALMLALVLTGTSTGGLAVYAEGETAISALTAAIGALEADGGEVKLTLEGTGLSADNWDISATVALKDAPDFDTTSRLKISYKDKSASGVTAVVPENPMRNDMVITFTAKSGDSEASATVELAKETRTFIDLGEPKSLEMTDNDTITATFDREIEAVDGAWKKIFIANHSNENEGRIDMDDNGTVTAEGKVLVMTFSKPLSLDASQSALYIQKGAIKTGDAYNSSFKWIIASKPMITGVEFDRDVFDSKGGSVVANLTGVKVTSVENITAKVFEAGENTEEADIETTIENGKVYFEVPANTGNTTKSYTLNVKVNGVPIYEGAGMDQARMAVVSVMAEGADPAAQTLSCLTITGNNKVDADSNNKKITVNVEKQVGSLKTVLRVFGTNLDSAKTEVRAIDENGVLWPVYHIPECDGTIRFVAVSGSHSTGVTGDGNTQLIEVLPPRYAGTNKTYTIQVALDGVHFEDAYTVELTVQNEGISGESEFVNCGAEDIKYVTVNYVDQETGKAVAEPTRFKGYTCSMVQAYDIKAADVEGYELVESPEIDWDNGWVGEGVEYTYKYKKTDEGTNPGTDPDNPGTDPDNPGVDPENPDQPDTPEDSDLKDKVDELQETVDALKETVDVLKEEIKKLNLQVTKMQLDGSLLKPSVKAGKKAVTASWKKVSAANGYQLSVSTKKSSTKIVKIGNVRKYTKKALKSKKKYYVKVRAYKTVDGSRVYGSWSSIKSVKTR